MTQTYLVRKPVKVGDETRQPGELCPEAATWFRVDHLVHSGFLLRVERTDEEIAAAVAGFVTKAEERAAILERDTKRDYPIDTTVRPTIGQPLAKEGIAYTADEPAKVVASSSRSNKSAPTVESSETPSGDLAAGEATVSPEGSVAAAEHAAQNAADSAAEGDAQGAVAAAEEAHKAAASDATGEAQGYAEIADQAADEALSREGYKLPRTELEAMGDADLVDLAKSAGIKTRSRDKIIDRLAE